MLCLQEACSSSLRLLHRFCGIRQGCVSSQSRAIQLRVLLHLKSIRILEAPLLRQGGFGAIVERAAKLQLPHHGQICPF